MKVIYHIAVLLAAIGTINWGLIGGLDYNLVEALLGAYPLLVKVIYDLIGLSGLFFVMQLVMCARGKSACCGSECKK